MPRYRGTTASTATVAGQLLILIARGKENSTSLAIKLKVSARQINRYVLQLKEGGWIIERRGSVRLGTYWFELTSPKIVSLPLKRRVGFGLRRGVATKSRPSRHP